jgi:hypothetical protein
MTLDVTTIIGKYLWWDSLNSRDENVTKSERAMSPAGKEPPPVFAPFMVFRAKVPGGWLVAITSMFFADNRTKGSHGSYYQPEEARREPESRSTRTLSKSGTGTRSHERMFTLMEVMVNINNGLSGRDGDGEAALRDGSTPPSAGKPETGIARR